MPPGKPSGRDLARTATVATPNAPLPSVEADLPQPGSNPDAQPRVTPAHKLVDPLPRVEAPPLAATHAAPRGGVRLATPPTPRGGTWSR